MGRPTKITIHLDALKHNFKQVKKLAPHSQILAMVKSNAYGHGLERIGLALQDADALGVACIEEGLKLRAAGVQKPIVLLEGLFTGDEVAHAIQNNFTLVVHHALQVEMLEKSHTNKPLSIWLKIDTGMHRLGFLPADLPEVYQRLMQCQAVKKPIGLMTHFAESDALDKTTTQKQIKVFNSVTEHLVGPRSLSNSGGIIAWPSAHAEWVRPGIMLYGASPFAGKRGNEHNLLPVMSLSSELIAIHQIAKGERIGYGGTFTCPEDMLVGVVGIGYGDGYPQFAKNTTPILVNKTICPLIGRVSMDMLTVDLRPAKDPKVGDPVILWGPGLPVEMIAESNHTSAYELLTRMMPRVHVLVSE
jgi:alanine racemase